MTPEQLNTLATEHKYAGFDKRFDEQVKTLSANGTTDFSLRTQDMYENSRMLYTVQSRVGGKDVFYNGFEATIVKNIPADFKEQGVDLRDIEIRLSSPPRQEMGKSAGEGQFEQAQQTYFNDMGKDLGRLYDVNPNLFYKIAFIYKDVVDPLLTAEARTQVQENITAMTGQDIRKQWFPREQRITRIEAFNLLDEVDHQRAVYKVYRVKEKTDKGPDQDPGHTTAPAQSDGPREKKTYGEWLLLDYKDIPAGNPENKPQNPTKHGNRLFERYNDKYGFDIRTVIQRFAWEQINDDKSLEQLAKALEKGDRVALVPVNKAEHAIVFIYANPAAKTITIEDAHANRQPHSQFLTEAARKDREQRQEQGSKPFQSTSRAVQSNFGATPPEADGEKKNNQSARVIRPEDKGRGPHM